MIPVTRGIILAMPLGGDRHVTVVYLGKTDDPDQLPAEALHALLRPVNAPQTAEATELAHFGPDESGYALVELLRSESLSRAHTYARALAGPLVKSVWPEYRPHVTLGYYSDPDDMPAEGTPVEAVYESEGLELWYGGAHYPLADPFPSPLPGPPGTQWDPLKAGFTAAVLEFYNPSQPRDRDGRWTDGAGRTIIDGVPIPKLTSRELDGYAYYDTETADQIRTVAMAAFEGPLPHGVRSVVDEDIEHGPDGSFVSGRFERDGAKIGTFLRVFSPDGSVSHEQLKIDAEHQGRGISDAFNARAEEVYRAAGFNKIVLLAGYDVGGYTWAVRGFGWADDRLPQGVRSALQAIGGNAPGEVTKTSMFFDSRLAESENRYKLKERPQVSDEAVDMQIRINQGWIPTPADLVALGKDHTWTRADGRTTWVGKELMLGSVWNGEKHL